MDTLHERLREARKKAGHSSARSAAMRFGWSPSTYAAHENGQNSFDAETALRYATAFKTDPSWLMFAKEGRLEETVGGYVLQLSGTIKEGGKVSYIDKKRKNDARTIVTFASFPSDCFLFIVEDNSLWPRYIEKDVLVMRPIDFSVDRDSFFGHDAIAIREDGDPILRQVVRTQEKGVYDLFAHNAPPIRNVALKPSLILNAVLAFHGYAERKGSEAGYRP